MADNDPKPLPESNPKDRLSQVTNHISPPKPKKSRNKSKSKKDDLPADYSDILGQLDTLRAIARKSDPSNKGYIRQLQAGKLWVRDRVLKLLDEGSFHEIGSVSGTIQWSTPSPFPNSSSPAKEEILGFVPSNNVQGIGRLGGRKVLLTADDFSIRAGHADGAMAEKTVYMEKLAVSMRVPIVKLVDGSSGGGSVTTIRREGYSYIPPMPSFKYVVEQLNAGIPNLGAVLGPAIGLGAARVVACHFSVMAGDVGSLFNAGPKVVAGATFEEDLSFTDLGGPSMHCTNGTIDNLAATELEAFDQLLIPPQLRPLSTTIPPPSDPADRLCPELRTIIPRRKARTYDPRAIITSVVDSDSWFEIGRLWGTTAIVGLARLSGRAVGIISNNCESNAGALDAAGSQKITRHLKFCDIFNIPILQFVDIPGYAIGTVAERTSTMRHGIALATTYYSTTTPIFSVITRRVYGVAGGIMLDCREPRMRVAWPSGEWGSLPLEGGIEVGHAGELREAEKEGGIGRKEEVLKGLREEYGRLMNPVRTAGAFGVEEIVDPGITRGLVCAWVQHVYEELLPIRLLERANGKIHPQFY
ncbi:carboxyl transferase [Halenospora varia]|nr:carboxyl transferase [Halenospora varia]